MAEPQPRDLILGLEKGLAVITAFERGGPRLTIADVAGLTGLTRAAARRCLITLEHLGYVARERRLFTLTPKVLRLAQSYMNSSLLPRIVEPELHRLAHQIKEASSAGVLDGDDVLCIAATTAGRVVSMTLQPGTRVPAWCTANGRVLVAALPDDEARDWIARQQPVARTPQTITDLDLLQKEIERVRTQGWALVDRELEPELRTLSVPLLGRRGELRAAINLSVHAARFGVERLLEVGLPVLRETQTALKPVL